MMRSYLNRMEGSFLPAYDYHGFLQASSFFLLSDSRNEVALPVTPENQPFPRV